MAHPFWLVIEILWARSELQALKYNMFIHTSVFVSFSPIHTKILENDENDWDLGLRMR